MCILEEPNLVNLLTCHTSEPLKRSKIFLLEVASCLHVKHTEFTERPRPPQTGPSSIPLMSIQSRASKTGTRSHTSRHETFLALLRTRPSSTSTCMNSSEVSRSGVTSTPHFWVQPTVCKPSTLNSETAPGPHGTIHHHEQINHREQIQRRERI